MAAYRCGIAFLVFGNMVLLAGCKKDSAAAPVNATPAAPIVPPTSSAPVVAATITAAIPTAPPTSVPVALPAITPGSGSCKPMGGSVNAVWEGATGFASASDFALLPPNRPRCTGQTVKSFIETRLPDKFSQWDFFLRDPGLAPFPASTFESFIPLLERCYNEYLVRSTIDVSATGLTIRNPGDSIETCFKTAIGPQQIAFEMSGRYSIDFGCNGQLLTDLALKSLVDPVVSRDFCKNGSAGKMRFTGYVSLSQPGATAGSKPLKLYRRLLAIGDKFGNACSFTGSALATTGVGSSRVQTDCVLLDKIERETGLAWYSRAVYGGVQVSYGTGMLLSNGVVSLDVGVQEGTLTFPALNGAVGGPGRYSLGSSFGTPFLSAVSGSMPQR